MQFSLRVSKKLSYIKQKIMKSIFLNFLYDYPTVRKTFVKNYEYINIFIYTGSLNTESKFQFIITL